MSSWIIGILLLICVFLFISSEKQKKAVNTVKKERKMLESQIDDLKRNLDEEENQIEVMKERCEELKKQEEKSRKQAMTDHVTGLPNRAAFTEILDGVLKTLRKEENVALMHIDVDHFKRISETLGRSYGDELLIDVTDRLRQVMDDNDFFACLSGDQFLVLSQNISDIGEYEEKVKKIRNVFSYPFVLAAKEVFITVSIGIAFAPKDGKTTQTILKNLDSALFQAKSSGKNNYCYYDDAINKDLMGQIELQAQIRSGIENEEFVVYYQPQIDLNTNEIEGFEALLRWNHPRRGVLLPAEFVPTAEATGLMVAIGKWMLREISLQLKKWESQGLGKIKVSINLSGRQFDDAELLRYAQEVFEEMKVDPSQITMEITEDIALADLDRTISNITKLKELGIRFSLDNFGTGYTSMNYLKKLPMDNVKIDKTFLDGLLEEEGNEEVVKAMISLAKAFHFNVIVQGVESESQESFLKKADCNVVQGFLYSEPIQVDMAGRLLEIVKEGGKIEDAVWF